MCGVCIGRVSAAWRVACISCPASAGCRLCHNVDSLCRIRLCMRVWGCVYAGAGAIPWVCR
jgi:hypothetical protein